MKFLSQLRRQTKVVTRDVSAADPRAGAPVSAEPPALPSRRIHGRHRSEVQVGELKAPVRSSFPDDDSYADAYLKYQTVRMGALKQEHLNAWGDHPLFHGCDLPPEVVFAKGLAPKGGDCFDLQKHQRDFHSPAHAVSERSALRGGGDNAVIAAGMTGEGGWVYLLQPLGGSIYLDAALMHRQVRGARGETELSFGSAQPPSRVIGARPVKRFSWASERYQLGDFIPNPNVDPDIRANVDAKLVG